MARQLYPIGIQTFEEIRRLSNLYIDKSEYVYRITHTDGKYFFLSRPRRFGKSLLVSTFKSYFEGRKDLFKGLAIENLETEWAQHPVLLFDMSTAKHLNEESLTQELNYRLLAYEKIYGKNEGEINCNNRLQGIIERAYRQTGKQVVVLIDEYDAPLLDVVHENENLEKLRHTMRNFYSPLKACDPYIRFVFITGITKFSQLSIFSELNNIKNISMLEQYAGICGITKEELLTQMKPDIDALAQKLKLTPKEVCALLSDHYDGYHFTWPSPDVFNPFSILNCFSDGMLGDYWFASGTPTFLIEMMKKFDFSITELGESISVGKNDFDAPTETMSTITPLLYQSGYITIKGYDKETDLYTLAMPNKEVAVGMYRSLLPHYLERNTTKGNTTIAKMSVLIKNGDMNQALQLMADFLQTVPYCHNAHSEGHYQQMLYIMFALLSNYRIAVEQHTSTGRIDLVLETSRFVYVMELKFNKSPQEALRQICDKQYARAYALSDKQVVKVGMNFSTENGINLMEWAIE